MTVYLAHPMDQAGSLPVMVDELRFLLTRAGESCFIPSSAWNQAATTDADRQARAEVNRCAQQTCDVTVAVLPDGVPTLGTPAEIERAIEQLVKPTYIYAGEKVAETVQVAEWEAEGARVFVDPINLVKALQEDDPELTVFKSVGVKLEGGQLPTRGYEGDAGWDLYATQGGRIPPGGYVELATDIRVALPPGTWGLLVGRSSTAKKGLLVNQAVIDNGYTGPMFFGVTNVSPNDVTVHAGDRLAQLIPMPLLAAEMPIREVDDLPKTDRGDAGFGSTGN